MLFASFSFIIFLILTVLIYFSVPVKRRWIVILLSSLYFYISLRPEWGFLIVLSILFNYGLGIGISALNKDKPSKAKALVYFGISANLLYLIVFKYANFISDSISQLVGIYGIQLTPLELAIILPVGISFYTFQNISYLLDVYKKRYEPEKHLGLFSAYVLFFPKFVSGPIERPSNFLTQLKEEKRFNAQEFTSGLTLIAWGLFKKLVIADRLGILVDAIYSNPTNYNTPYLAVATVFFAFQLYADFSGYTNIALGTARLMGYKLTENFRRPYLSKSVSEFWKRWHISLSSWFQDYVFVPLYLVVSKLKSLSELDSKKKHTVSFIISILIGEVLLGVWHGANLTFVFFGLYYGIVITLYYLIREKWDKMNKYIQIIFTFILANIAWIFFRANTISDAFYIIKSLFFNISFEITRKSIGVGYSDLILGLLGILLLIIYDIMEENDLISKISGKLHPVVKAALFIAMILLTVLFGIYTYSQFIYFQF